MTMNSSQTRPITGKRFFSINCSLEKPVIRQKIEKANIQHECQDRQWKVAMQTLGYKDHVKGKRIIGQSIDYVDHITTPKYSQSPQKPKTGTLLLIGIISTCAIMTATILPIPWSFITIGFAGPLITLVRRLLK